MSNARVDQLIREADVAGTPHARVDQFIREADVAGTPHARVDQFVREAAVQINAHARVDQLVREAFIALPVIRIDQLVREAFVPVATVRIGKVPITGGAFQDAQGNPVAFGTLIMDLSQDAMVKTSPGQVAEAITLYIPLDANGNISGIQLVWPTDQLLPIGLTYMAWVQTKAGAQVWGPFNETVTTPPFGSFDITSNWTTPLP